MADLDDDSEAPESAAPPSPMKWIVSGGLAIFLAVLGAQVTAPILTRMVLGDPNAPVEEVVEDEDEDGERVEEVAFEDRGPAVYTPLDPPLLASFEASGSTRYLQLSVQAMGRDAQGMDLVRTHAPALRNAFLFLISNYTYEDIATVAGKEQLRAAMLSEAQAIMKRNTGSPQIEEIYFTSFVVQ
jgi:flagellar FliL protein